MEQIGTQEMENTTMGNPTALSKLSVARKALIEAKTLNEVLSAGDMAAAIRAYAKASGESLEIQNAASDLRLSAERKAGELLASMDLRSVSQKANDSLSLADIGVTAKQSSRWQLAAKLPDDEYAAIVSHCNTSGKELTQAAVLRAARVFVFGEPESFEPAEPDQANTNANLLDLISMARGAIADLVDAFGESRIETLIGVLRDEIESLEGSVNVRS
jgi:hypothetical protein